MAITQKRSVALKTPWFTMWTKSRSPRGRVYLTLRFLSEVVSVSTGDVVWNAGPADGITRRAIDPDVPDAGIRSDRPAVGPRCRLFFFVSDHEPEVAKRGPPRQGHHLSSWRLSSCRALRLALDGARQSLQCALVVFLPRQHTAAKGIGRRCANNTLS